MTTRNRKLKWIEPGHYPKSERIHLPGAEVPTTPKVRPVKGRKQKNPHHEEPRPRYKKQPPRKPFERVNDTLVKDREGYVWEHVVTADASETKRLIASWDRKGVEYKVVKTGELYEIYIRR